MAQLFPIIRRLCPTGPILLAVALALIASSICSESWATDGFDLLTWGMTRDQVSAAYEGRVKNDTEPRGAPPGTDGSRLIIESGSRLFGEPVELSCFFDSSGLVTIRLQYVEPKAENVEKLVNWYEPHWGEPIKSTDRESQRNLRKRVWAWPWEGVSLRGVEEDGSLKYQRVDFSSLLAGQWAELDSALCSMLPTSSNCPRPDTICPQQDNSMPEGKRSQMVRVADTPSEITCSYRDYALTRINLSVDGPSEQISEWFHRLLQTHLGEFENGRSDTSAQARIDTKWPQHKVEFREIRKATVRTSSGWTGPLIQLRVRRSLGPGTSQSKPSR